MWVDWHQAHWLELARQSSQVRRLGARRRARHRSAGPSTPPNTPSLAHQGSLAAEWGTLLWALQGTPAPAPPAACRIPFAAGALMPLTEGVLGVEGAGA